MKELFEKKLNLSDEIIDQIKYNFFSNILLLNNQEALESAICYAHYLNNIGLNNDNYPAFLKILSTNNEYVTDALLGSQNSFLFMNNLQPNYFIISTCFSYLIKFKSNQINDKLLEIILGYLQTIYNPPVFGYKLYPPTMFDLNNLSKYYNKENEKNNPVNTAILEILEKISNLENESFDKNMEELAIHAHNIRNNLIDLIKKIDEVLPSVLLKNEINDITKIQPRKKILLSKIEKNDKKS